MKTAIHAGLRGMLVGYCIYVTLLTLAMLLDWRDFDGTASLLTFVSFLAMPFLMPYLILNARWIELSDIVAIMGFLCLSLMLVGYTLGLALWLLRQKQSVLTLPRNAVVGPVIVSTILITQLITSVLDVRNLNARVGSGEFFVSQFKKKITPGMTENEVNRIIVGHQRVVAEGVSYKKQRFIYRLGWMKYIPGGMKFGEIVVSYDAAGKVANVRFE